MSGGRPSVAEALRAHASVICLQHPSLPLSPQCGSLIAQLVKNLPAMQGRRVQFLGRELRSHVLQSIGGLLGVAGRLSGTVSPFRAEQGHEGALPPPFIVRKDPRVPHIARRGA